MKKRVAFIGSGELAVHIAHYMVEDDQFEVVGYFDDYSDVGTENYKYRIIGKLDDVESAYRSNLFDELVNGIGFTRMAYRKEVFNRFVDKVPFANFIHSSCLIDSTAKIGQGVIIFPMSMLYFNSIIEDNIFIQVRSSVTDSRIKKHTMISANVIVAGRAEIGESCNIGVSTTINSDTKICGLVRTGAGCVVNRDIEEPGTYVGVPARKIKNTI